MDSLLNRSLELTEIKIFLISPNFHQLLLFLNNEFWRYFFKYGEAGRVQHGDNRKAARNGAKHKK